MRRLVVEWDPRFDLAPPEGGKLKAVRPRGN